MKKSYSLRALIIGLLMIIILLGVFILIKPEVTGNYISVQNDNFGTLSDEPSVSGDYFDWNVRLDRHGKKAGIFETTPFPIYENTSNYTIMNDEYPNGRTYFLGQKYYVDGGYDGRNGATDGSWDKPWKNLTLALQSIISGSQNAAIIIRGTNNRWGNNFNGIYYGTYSLSNFAGINDTNRFIIAGYGQERPILDAGGTGFIIYRNSETLRDSFITIQRLKLQNTYNSCVRMGWDVQNDKRSNYFNTIDVYMYNCASNVSAVPSDGNLYYLNVDNGWIFHSTSEHTTGHGYKMGDGTSNHIIEWSVAKDVGFWYGGFPYSSYFGSSATGIDFPTDSFARAGRNNIARYNIVQTALYYGIQIRYAPNISIHHNELFDSNKFDDVDMSVKGVSRTQAYIGFAGTYGEFYSNVIRDPGSKDTPGVLLSGAPNNIPHSFNIYNNLFYGGVSSSGSLPYGGGRASAINVGYNDNLTINIINNNFYSNTINTIIQSGNGRAPGSNLFIKNNIFYQSGNGSIIDFNGYSDWSNHTYNIYYSPNGSVGVISGIGELNANPEWRSIPSENYNEDYIILTSGSPAIDSGSDLSELFNKDFLETVRPLGSAWDIGAYEYLPGAVSYTNGRCGSNVDSCLAGDYQNITDNLTHYLWKCNSPDGGANDTCNFFIPMDNSDDTRSAGDENTNSRGRGGSSENTNIRANNNQTINNSNLEYIEYAENSDDKDNLDTLKDAIGGAFSLNDNKISGTPQEVFEKLKMRNIVRFIILVGVCMMILILWAIKVVFKQMNHQNEILNNLEKDLL